MLNLTTKEKISWCPGCTNSQVLVAFRKAVTEMVEKGAFKIENLVAFAGIGCHGKISDYINVNSFTSLHGRLIPAMTGAKCANPNLTIVGFSGDGDSFDEGVEHLVHAAKRNSDIKLFIHENQLFALTTGQANAISAKGFKSKSTPFGNIEEPFNPLLLLLAAGATFVARSYAGDIAGTQKIMQKAIEHKGFALVEIVQPCITLFDTREFFKDKFYWLPPDFATNDLQTAMQKVSENEDLSAQAGKIPLGVFYDVNKSTFEENLYNLNG
jgi:2-oxoglutarate/2-oxoacid ferredoxin oxidoreductase subunit beta